MINIFGGNGFVGTWLRHELGEDIISNERMDYDPKTNDILWLISTTHNYHVSEGDSFKDIESNLVALMMTLDNARKKFGNDFTFNFISSWFVYGKTNEIPARETSRCNPTGPYAITKRAAEQMLIHYCETFGSKYRILRLANVLGVGDKNISRKKNAVQYMIRELTQGREIPLYLGRFLRDFIDVRDVVRAVRLILEKGETNQIYNIGSGTGYAVYDVIAYAGIKTQNSKINKIPVPEFHKQVQVENMYLDVTKLRKLGFKPRYDILQTIDWLVDHYRNE